MVDAKIIAEATQKLITTYNPIEIYLFGSYVWGKPNEESDLDFLVIVDECNNKVRYSALVEGHRALVGMNISKDIFLLSKREFDEYGNDPRRMYYKIKNQGRKLYARA